MLYTALRNAGHARALAEHYEGGISPARSVVQLPVFLLVGYHKFQIEAVIQEGDEDHDERLRKTWLASNSHFYADRNDRFPEQSR